MENIQLVALLNFGGEVFRLVELVDGSDFADTLRVLHWAGVESIQILEVEQLKDIK